MTDWLLDGVGGLPLFWLLVIAFALALAQTVVLVDVFMPGQTGMIVMGAAAAEAELSVVLVIVVATAGTFLGGSTSWYLGHRCGTAVVDRWPRLAKRVRPLLGRAQRYFERRGGPAVLGCRFVGPLRSTVQFIAGAGEMSYRRFAPWSLAGSALWSATLVSLGAIFGRAFISAVEPYGIVVSIVVVAAAVVLGGYWWMRSRRARRRLDVRDDELVAEPGETA